jgi:hypothetical protein
MYSFKCTQCQHWFNQLVVLAMQLHGTLTKYTYLSLTLYISLLVLGGEEVPCNLTQVISDTPGGTLVSQHHFGQVWGWSPTLGKVGGLESSGTPKCSELDSKAQNTSHWGVLGVIGKVLKRRYQNGLALAIQTSASQVMGKRRAGSQTGSLTSNH